MIVDTICILILAAAVGAIAGTMVSAIVFAVGLCLFRVVERWSLNRKISRLNEALRKIHSREQGDQHEN